MGYIMNNGWVKINREIKKHWIWESSDFFKYWIDMLMMANWKDNKKYFKGKLYIIKRGSFPTSFRSLSQKWNTSTGKVRRFIELLKNDKMIDTHSDMGFTLIKICNYDKYQNENDKQTDTVTDTVTDTTLRKKRNKERKNNTYTSEFEEFYSLYPKNVGKKPAFTKYKQVLKKISHIDLITALKKQIDAGVWNIDKQFIPLAATWLNKERWNDEIEDLRPAKKTTKAVFRQTKTGLFIAYCSKCNKKQYPNEYQLKQDGCCGVELSPIPIEKKMDNGFTDLQAENFLKEIEKRVTV